ncbi:MAG: aldolase [Chloroflexi bacterium]|nr:aldolase [Chloroflexota bacterium]
MAANYTLENYRFDLKTFFPDHIFDKITEIRVDAPEIIMQQAQERKRRHKLALNGKLTILAADHPARGVTHIGADPFIMGDRQQYMGRILRVLTATEFDGFMSTPDMIEDLFIIDYLVQNAGGPSFLDEKVLIGCMQRGGVAGVVGEIDDRFGSYTAESLARFRLDGGKMLLRFDPEDERTLNTIDYCARAVTDLNRYELPAFVEPLRMQANESGWTMKNTADELVKLVGVLAGFGDSSRNTWLKVPYCQDFHRVTQATTLPIILLGGPSKEDPRTTYQEFAAGMATRANVRGAMVGRNVTFPGADDPAAVAQALQQIVHHGASAQDAIEITMNYRDTQLDFLTQHIR